MATPGGRSYTIPENTLSKTADLLEILANLNYLARADAGNPELVDRWTREAEISIKKMGILIQSVLYD